MSKIMSGLIYPFCTFCFVNGDIFFQIRARHMKHMGHPRIIYVRVSPWLMASTMRFYVTVSVMLYNILCDIIYTCATRLILCYLNMVYRISAFLLVNDKNQCLSHTHTHTGSTSFFFNFLVCSGKLERYESVWEVSSLYFFLWTIGLRQN